MRIPRGRWQDVRASTSHWEVGGRYRGGAPNFNKLKSSFDLGMQNTAPSHYFWEFTYRQPPTANLRETKRAAKQVGKDLVLYWGRRIFPKHFVRGAGTEYHYQRRKGVTIFLKQRFYGHSDPLVKKGNMQLHLQHSQVASSTSTGGRLRMLGPWYTGHRGADGAQPDKPNEMTRVSDRDAKIMATVLDAMVAAQVKKNLAGKVEKGRIG